MFDIIIVFEAITSTTELTMRYKHISINEREKIGLLLAVGKKKNNTIFSKKLRHNEKSL